MKYLVMLSIVILTIDVSFAQQVEEDKVYKEVDQMPVFPGCKDVEDYKSRFDCGNVALVKYVSKKLKYPKAARKNNIQGMVYVQFVVNKDGTVSDIRIAKDIGYGCGEAVKDVVRSMNKRYRWAPGQYEGKPVRVLFTLPISFNL